MYVCTLVVCTHGQTGTAKGAIAYAQRAIRQIKRGPPGSQTNATWASQTVLVICPRRTGLPVFVLGVCVPQTPQRKAAAAAGKRRGAEKQPRRKKEAMAEAD
jgi:hypothetical protein